MFTIDLETIRIKYQACVNLFAYEGQAQWDRFNSILIVNSILFGLIGLSFHDDHPNVLLQLFISILGIATCYHWLKINKRGFTWMNHWITMANQLEIQMGGKVNPTIKGGKLRSELGFDITKKSTLGIIYLVVLIYLIILLSFIPWANSYAQLRLQKGLTLKLMSEFEKMMVGLMKTKVTLTFATLKGLSTN